MSVTIDPSISLLPHMQAGKVRVLAMTGSRRSAAFPDIPTVAESGVRGYAFDNWHAIDAKRTDLPRPVLPLACGPCPKLIGSACDP